MNSIIEVQNVKFDYGEAPVLRGVDLTIKQACSTQPVLNDLRLKPKGSKSGRPSITRRRMLLIVALGIFNTIASGLVERITAILSAFAGYAMAQTATPAANPAATNLMTRSASKAATSNLPDTQIAKILLTINDGEIDAGKVAKSNAQNQAVKDFAAMMVDQHEKNVRETKDLVKKNKINPEDSDAAKALNNDAKDALKDLKRQKKVEFDRAYLKQQIAMHEKALNELDNTLIPAAQNPEFKAHLQKTRSAVAEHLTHARELQTKL